MAHFDALVINAVESVRDRLGAEGLRSLIELAQREVDRTEAAWAQLGNGEDRAVAETPGEDTQQFQAFVQSGEADDELR